MSRETINTLLKTLAESSVLIHKSEIYHLYALFYGNGENYGDAIKMADKSLSLGNNRHLRLQRLIWLQLEGRYAKALEAIRQIRASLNIPSSFLYLEELNKGEKFIQKLLEIQQQQNDNSN